MIWSEVSCDITGKGSRYAALDFETTGLRPDMDSRVWQVGIALFDDEQLVDTQEILVDPGIPPEDFEWDNGSLPTQEELSEAPTFSEIAGEMERMTEGRVIVGHRLGFDAEFWRNECLRAGLDPPQRSGVCSKVLAYAAGEQGDLFDLAANNGISVDPKMAHTACADAVASGSLATRLIKKLGGVDHAEKLHAEKVSNDLHLINYYSTEEQDNAYYFAHGMIAPSHNPDQHSVNMNSSAALAWDSVQRSVIAPDSAAVPKNRCKHVGKRTKRACVLGSGHKGWHKYQL